MISHSFLLILSLASFVRAFRIANTKLSQVSRISSVDASGVLSIQDMYHQVLENNGLLTDMTTVFISNAVSDCIAQYSEKQKVIDVSLLSATESPMQTASDGSPSSFNVGRVVRFAIFGFFVCGVKFFGSILP